MTGKEWRQLALTLLASNSPAAAVAAFLRAHQDGENDAEYHREFSSALWALNDRDNAIKEIYKAQLLDKDSFNISFQIGTYLASSGDYRGSVKWLTHALKIRENEPQARFNRALWMLASGDWENGWKEYEARADLYPLDFPKPEGVSLWKGNASLDGKLIWVTSEQGLGDQIQFSRYIPWLRAQGAAIIFDSHAELADFSFAGDVFTRTMGPAGKWKVPEIDGRKPDYYIPLMSLPSRHKTTKDNVPPPPNWYKKVASSFGVELEPSARKKIGLVWAGHSSHPGDHLRSCPLEALLPMTGTPGCDFYVLQVGKRLEDIRRLGAEPLFSRILSLALWPQTCSVLRQLDALVTVDTSVAHMAGSLGVKTFMMASTEPDWRWGGEGETTPWYSSMKIIRQKSRGDWGGVALRVCDELARL